MNEEAGVPVQTVVYAWGYGPPSLPLFREHVRATDAARLAAASYGWDATRKGAWAVELILPASRRSARWVLEAEARRDPAVTGWAMRDHTP